MSKYKGSVHELVQIKTIESKVLMPILAAEVLLYKKNFNEKCYPHWEYCQYLLCKIYPQWE